MNKKSLFFLFFILFIFLNYSFASNNDDYKKGWEAFSTNNRTEARQYFNEALKNPETKNDAMLSLALLDWSESKIDAAYMDFTQFYENTNNPYSYLYAMSALPFLYKSQSIFQKNKLDFFLKIVEDPNMNGTLKAMIAEDLGSHYLNLNNSKTAQEWYDKMGTINHWQVLGTFDNTSGSGFSKDWGTVTKAKTTDVFKNKVDADIKWYTPSYNKPNNWFHFEYYFYLNSTIIYTQSFVKSPIEQDVYLRAGTSGSLKIWINDALISSVIEERNCDLDIYSYKIHLNKGANRILVQIGQSEIDNSNFMIRLTDEHANPISGLIDEANYSDYKKSDAQPTNDLIPFFAEDFLMKKIKESPDNPLNYFLLAETYLRNDKAYEATKVLKELEEKTPNCTLLSYRLSEAYSRANNKTDYDKEIEKIKHTDPNSFIALQEFYDEAVNSEKYSEAAEIIEKTKNLYGENTTTEGWDINLASYQNRYDDIIEMSKALYKKYPYSSNYMNLNYLIKKNTSNNPKSAIAIIENYCRYYSNTDALDLLATAYFEQGNADKGLLIMKQRVEKRPYAYGFLNDLSSTLFRMQKYKEALAVTDQMLALSPYISSVYNTRGYIYKALKDDVKAKENFEKSIYYGPTSYDSRSQLRLLNNQKEVSELFPKNDLSEIIEKSPTASDYPQDNSILLLNDMQLVVYQEGAKEYRYEIAAKILNQSGIDVWKEYRISYNSNSQKLIVDKAEVIKANGSKAKAETDGDNNIVFTNLEVNDVLHLDYRVQDMSSGKLANHFFGNFSFQYYLPSLLNRYSILVPNNKEFKYIVANGKIEPTISDIENMKLYQWELTNQPGIKDEPSMSELADIAPYLYYSSIPDWKFISSWYNDLTVSKFKSDYVLQEAIAEILKGKENASPLEKAKLFYNYILENISYSNVSFLHSNFVPQKASRTITTRLGDCKDVSTLFVALCREVGIEANLVLISTRNNGNKTMLLPSVDFNHCIAQLNLNGKAYYLELTDNTLPFSAIPAVDLNSEILPIPFSNETFGDKLITLQEPFRKQNFTERYQEIKVLNNDLQIKRHTIFHASVASTLRDSYRNIGTEEQLKTINEAVASEFSMPIKVSDLKFNNLDNLKDSLMIDYSIDIKNALQDVAGMKILKLPWTDKVNSLELVNAEKRNHTLELWSYFTKDMCSEQIIITLPQGKSFVEIPKNVSLDCANASYQVTFKQISTEKIIVKRSFKRKTEQVSASEYNAFRDFFNLVSESDNKQYAIK